MKASIVRAAACFLLGAGLCACSPPRKSVIIFCAGDSITEQGYPRILRRLLQEEGIKARVLNYGRSGFTSGEYLTFLKRNRESLAEEHPDFILLQLGTNDVRLDQDHTSSDAFSRHLQEIIQIFKEFRNRWGRPPRLILATIPPIPQGETFPFGPSSSLRVEEEINPMIRQIAEEKGLMFVDNHAVFLQNPSLLPGVHPSETGYRALAQNWLQALKKAGIGR